MAERVRLSQEEEIIEMLEREGFEELTCAVVPKEPHPMDFHGKKSLTHIVIHTNDHSNDLE